MKTTLLLFLVLLSLVSADVYTQEPLRVTDGATTFTGINELRFPSGTVKINGRSASIGVAPTGSGSGSGSSSQNANLIFASPNGSYGIPSWRQIVNADVLNLDASKVTTGTFGTARLGSGSASSSTWLRGDGTWTALPAALVSSVFGRTGAITATSGDYTTDLVTEGSNLYYTDARARAALSVSAPIGYSAGAFSFSFNATNLKLTSGALNTIQDLSIISTPSFASGAFTGSAALSASGLYLSYGETADTSRVTSITPGVAYRNLDFHTGTFRVWTGSGGVTKRFEIDTSGNVQISGVPIFANNAAAITGGLTAGSLYRTGGDPDLLAIVH